MRSHSHKTAIVWLVLLLPSALFLFILKTSRNENSIFKEPLFLVSQGSVSEIAQFRTASSNCKCNCDTNTSDFNGDETTVFSATNEDLNEVLYLNETENSDTQQQLLQSTTSINSNKENNIPVIYVITPTYFRPTQLADMTRFAQTLMLINEIFWIVVEDATERNVQVTELLERSRIPYVHLLGPRPKTHLDKRSGRGVSNRLKALEWIRENLHDIQQRPGVMYFADDDNTYDIRLFEEMRHTKKVSVWPVGLLSNLGLSAPIVNKDDGKVIGFHDPFTRRRKFAVDMAGFAVNLQLFLAKPKATMPYKVGYEEDYFIKSLGITLEDLEVKANNCTEILVWHTKTQTNVLPSYANLIKEKRYSETNLPLLYSNSLRTSEHIST